MALIGNRSVLLKAPGRQFAGPTVSDNRSACNSAGASRGMFCGAFAAKSAIPRGCRPPASWVIAIKPGDLASANAITGAGTTAAAGTMGLNAEASISGAGDITAATAQLVISMVATLAGSGTASAADLRGYLNAAASLSGGGDVSAALAAIAWADAALSGTGTISTATPYASGELAATIRGYSDLTPESLRDKVWQAPASAFTEPGTLGAKLNSAASGGVDYGSMATAVRDELQSELARIIELAKIHGLVIGADLTVTASSRSAGDVVQTITTAGGSTTVTRQP